MLPALPTLLCLLYLLDLPAATFSTHSTYLLPPTYFYLPYLLHLSLRASLFSGYKWARSTFDPGEIGDGDGTLHGRTGAVQKLQAID